MDTSTVFFGRNRRGNWVVREQNGAFGGLFVTRDQALKYALSKNGRHSETVIEVPYEIEIDTPINPEMREGLHGLICRRKSRRSNG